MSLSICTSDLQETQRHSQLTGQHPRTRVSLPHKPSLYLVDEDRNHPHPWRATEPRRRDQLNYPYASRARVAVKRATLYHPHYSIYSIDQTYPVDKRAKRAMKALPLPPVTVDVPPRMKREWEREREGGKRIKKTERNSVVGRKSCVEIAGNASTLSPPPLVSLVPAAKI